MEKIVSNGDDKFKNSEKEFNYYINLANGLEDDIERLKFELDKKSRLLVNYKNTIKLIKESMEIIKEDIGIDSLAKKVTSVEDCDDEQEHEEGWDMDYCGEREFVDHKNNKVYAVSHESSVWWKKLWRDPKYAKEFMQKHPNTMHVNFGDRKLY